MLRRRLSYKRIKIEISKLTSITVPNIQFYKFSHRQKRDQLRRLSFYSNEYNYRLLLQLRRSHDVPTVTTLPHSSITLVRNRCIYTARPLGIFTKYRISRIILKSLIEKGYWSGWQQI